MSAAAFPEPPKGSPGGIRAAARQIAEAGQSMRSAAQGLAGASGALQGDWKGWAAGSYLACTHGIEAPLRSGAEVFDSCQNAIDGYAELLETTQERIKALHARWVDAKAREAAAANLASSLSGQLLSAKPAQVSGIEAQLAGAATDEGAASGEAEQLVRQANDALQTFQSESKSFDDVLSGESLMTQGSIGNPASLLGGAGVGSGLNPGFGLLPGGLAAMNGVIAVEHPPRTVAVDPEDWILSGFGDQTKTEPNPFASTNVPGYEHYWTAVHGHSPDALQDDNSIFNPVTALVTLGTGGLAGAARAGLTRAADEVASGFATEAGETGAAPLAAKGAAAALSGNGVRASIDYSEGFLDDLAKFEPGTASFHTGKIDEDLVVAAYYDGGKDVGAGRSLKWWTSTSQGQEFHTVDDAMNQLALHPDWGPRNAVAVARIPKGTDLTFLHGEARAVGTLPGGAEQFRFQNFDESWIVKQGAIP